MNSTKKSSDRVDFSIISTKQIYDVMVFRRTHNLTYSKSHRSIKIWMFITFVLWTYEILKSSMYLSFICIHRVSENINNTSKWSAIIFMSISIHWKISSSEGSWTETGCCVVWCVARNKLWPTLKGQACGFERPFRIARSKDLLHVFQSRRPRTGTREPLINSYWSAGSRRVAGAVAMSSIFLLRAGHTHAARMCTRMRVPWLYCEAQREGRR